MEILLKKSGELHLPSQILRAMDIEEDHLLEVMVKNGRLILTPKKKEESIQIFTFSVLEISPCV